MADELMLEIVTPEKLHSAARLKKLPSPGRRVSSVFL